MQLQKSYKSMIKLNSYFGVKEFFRARLILANYGLYGVVEDIQYGVFFERVVVDFYKKFGGKISWVCVKCKPARCFDTTNPERMQKRLNSYFATFDIDINRF